MGDRPLSLDVGDPGYGARGRLVDGFFGVWTERGKSHLSHAKCVALFVGYQSLSLTLLLVVLIFGYVNEKETRESW